MKRYSSFRVVGIRCVRRADVHSVCIASSLQFTIPGEVWSFPLWQTFNHLWASKSDPEYI